MVCVWCTKIGKNHYENNVTKYKLFNYFYPHIKLICLYHLCTQIGPYLPYQRILFYCVDTSYTYQGIWIWVQGYLGTTCVNTFACIVYSIYAWFHLLHDPKLHEQKSPKKELVSIVSELSWFEFSRKKVARNTFFITGWLFF